MDLRDAERLSQYGGLAALLSVCISSAYTFNELYNLERSFELTIWEMLLDNWWMFLDAAIFLVLAIAVFRYSRAAAFLLVLLYAAGRVSVFMRTGGYQYLIAGLIFLYFYVNAVRGTFAYHSIMRADDPDYRAVKAWHFLVGVPAYIIIGGIMTLILIEQAGLMPALERFLNPTDG